MTIHSSNSKKEVNKENIISRCLELLADNDLSITAPRKLILTLLIEQHGPFTAEEIFNLLPKNSCDMATIYRCLKQFIEKELVLSVYLEKDITHFEFNDPHHHHHHIICKICKKIDSFHECIMDRIETGLLKKGYTNIHHRLELFAVCADCQ